MSLPAALKSLLTIALAAAAAALASGCGAGSAGAVLDPVARAAETTTGAGGARIAMQMRITVAGVPQQITIDAGGRLTFKSREGEISLQMNGLPGAAAGGLGEGGTITERFVGGKLFMNAPGLAGKLPAGASWVEIDLGAAIRKLGLDPQALTSGQSNPAQFLEYLRAGGGNVLASGTQRIRGVETTRYSGTLDLRKAPGAGAPAMKAAIDAVAAATGTSEIPVQAWVDSHRLIRKFTISMPLSADGRRIESLVSIEFFDFGPQPAVAAPAASETYEISAGALGARSSGSSLGG